MESEDIRLRYNRPLRVAGTTRIECVAGKVWLTVTGAAGDVFLHPGESFTVEWPDMALTEALGEEAGGAHVRLHPPRRWWRDRLSAAWRFLLSYAHARAAQYKGIYL